MKKLFLTLLTLILLVPTIYSQEFLGLRQSNYSGIMGSDLNPASIADSRFKFDLLIFIFNDIIKLSNIYVQRNNNIIDI